jgi:hypothetical protein
MPTIARAIPNTERRSGNSRKIKALAGISQKAAVYWSRMALAAVVALIAAMYRPVMAPNIKAQGTIAGLKIHRLRGTNGKRARPAKTPR